MICPKCRKQYPDGTDKCPVCDCELVGLLGDADAPETEIGKMQRIQVDSQEGFSPVVYRMIRDDDKPADSTGVIAIILLVIGVLLLISSIFCFVKGAGSSQADAASFSKGIITFFGYMLK